VGREPKDMMKRLTSQVPAGEGKKLVTTKLMTKEGDYLYIIGRFINGKVQLVHEKDKKISKDLFTK
jgi:hypothetical protein